MDSASEYSDHTRIAKASLTVLITSIRYCYDNQVECYRDDFFEEETIRPETWAARKLYVPEVEHAPRGGEYPGIHLLEETTPSPVTLHGSSIETGATQEPSSTSVPTSFEVFQPSRTSFPSVALDAFRGDELLAEILETISEPSHFNPPFPTGNDVHNDVAGLSLFRAVTSQGPAGMQPPSMNGVFPHLGMGEYVAGEAYDTAPDFLSEWMNTSAMSAGNWA